MRKQNMRAMILAAILALSLMPALSQALTVGGSLPTAPGFPCGAPGGGNLPPPPALPPIACEEIPAVGKEACQNASYFCQGAASENWDGPAKKTFWKNCADYAKECDAHVNGSSRRGAEDSGRY